MRNSFVFYRSFFEAISELDKDSKAVIYDAISNYSFNQIEPELTGICKTVWILIKPQLEANNRRYENGSKAKNKQTTSKRQAKRKQTTSKGEANDNDNVNDNANEKDNVDIHPLKKWVAENLKTVSLLKIQLTNKQCAELLEKYDKQLIRSKLEAMDNKPDLTKKYSSVYLTLKKWCEMEEEKKQPEQMDAATRGILKAMGKL